MECVPIDLNNICRTCRNESSEMKLLYCRDSESVKESPRLDEMLMACTSVQVNNDDDLPKSICRSCFVQLKSAYSFKEQCEKTDLFLRDYLKSSKNETIKVEIMTDLEFTSNYIDGVNSELNDVGEIKHDKSIANIKVEPESHLENFDEIVQVGTDIYAGSHPFEMVMKTTFEEEMYGISDEAEVANGNEYESDPSRHLDYLPTKQNSTKVKHDRGKPQELPVLFKPTGRQKGRPRPLKLKSKSPKNEIVNFPCPQCKEVFTNRTFLEKHAEQHDGLRIHECDSCDKKFTRWDHLKRHKLLHGAVRPFLCMTCNKCFTRKDHLQKHMRLHLSREVHSCDLCPAVFYQLDNLVKHKCSKHNIGEKVTEEEKEFLCSECGKRFIRNDCLVIHMRRHTGEKPFKCKFCGKGFPRMTDLTVHERYHTGEKRHLCVICGRRFGRAYNLNVHMRTHTGEKPYRCTYCDDVFRHGSDLKAHVRKHTGERFQCELCPRTFLMGHLLKQHKRVVHGLNIVSNKSRPQLIYKLNQDDSPPVTDSDPLELQQSEVSELKQEQKSDIM